VWNLAWNLEAFVAFLLGLAGAAVSLENLTIAPRKDLAEVKRAEIKAGSILGAFAVLFLLAVERLGIGFLREILEEGQPAETGK
jgi:hypothetical protein